MSRKLLIVYPHNVFADKSGINTRYLAFLNYFKSRNISVDMLALENFKSDWSGISNGKNNLIRNLYLYDFKKGAQGQQFKNRKRNLMTLLKRWIPFCKTYSDLPDFAYPGMKTLFDQLVDKERYDYVLISYALWANLINDQNQHDYTSVLEISDFLTLNRFDSSNGDVTVGRMIAEEINRVNLFDKVLCISSDEQFFFSQFAQHPQYYYVPFFMENNTDKTAERERAIYDLVFIGSDNPHNRTGWQWFLKNVIPILRERIKRLHVLLVGSISDCNRNTLESITVRPFAEDLTEIYRTAKIAICPLQGGTGMKSKTVEALSFGLPVVSTGKGVAGFPEKTNNGCVVADTAEHFADAIEALLTNQAFYLQKREEAIRFFNRYFNESVVYEALDRIFL